MAKTEEALETLVINYFPSQAVYEANKAQVGSNQLAIVPIAQEYTIGKDADGFYIEGE